MSDLYSTPSDTTRRIWKYEVGDGVMREVADEVAGEEPLEIRVRGRAVSVTMRTPALGIMEQRHEQDAELALGFLLSEGLIRSAGDVVEVAPCGRDAAANTLNVFLAAGCEVDLEKLTRHVFASSSCGVCGKATLESIQQNFEPVFGEAKVSAGVLLSLPGRLREGQATFGRTGGLHAAGLFGLDGKLKVLREDVGRHNAVDKVLGYALQRGELPLSESVLLVSGRASFEIVQKALAGGVAIIAAVSAPSSLAVELAQESGQTLVGFLREGRMNVYCHPERVVG